MPKVEFTPRNMDAYINIATKFCGVDIATSKPHELVGLTKSNETLGDVVNAETKGSVPLSYEFYHAVIAHANEKLDAQAEFVESVPKKIRTKQFNKLEVAKFHRELLKCLDRLDDDEINQTELTEHDIKDIVRRDEDLNKYVEDLTGSNEILALDLFTATARFIKEQDYDAFEDRPTLTTRPDNLKPKEPSQ